MFFRSSTDSSLPLLRRGFALVAVLMCLVLLMVLTLGLVGLSARELRAVDRAEKVALARANARLALVEALGQLQRHAAQDQRVTASSEMLGSEVKQKWWTGVWRSRGDDAERWVRDDLDGGLKDLLDRGKVRDGVDAWLVSGGDPRTWESGQGIEMVGEGSLGEGPEGVWVKEREVMGQGGGVVGRLAWWTGDLGTRADVGVSDRYAGGEDRDGVAESRRLAMAQDVEVKVMGASGQALAEGSKHTVVSTKTAEVGGLGVKWGRDRYFDFAVGTYGVLADVAEGGLKKDLTAFLKSDGEVPAMGDERGLADEDPLVGGGVKAGVLEPGSRHLAAAPRFGLLRSWARQALSLDEGEMAVSDPEWVEGDGRLKELSRALALVNEQPVDLREMTEASLQPILVEATQYLQMSAFEIRSTYPFKFQVRSHLYPRVVLWNPYPVALKTRPMMVMIQGNGRQEMWTESVLLDANRKVIYRTNSQWLSFEGGRSTEFAAEGREIMNTAGYRDPYMGSYYFQIPETTFEAGECLVFSPARSAEYSGLSAYATGSYDLSKNVLSCEVSPDPARSYYISGTEITGGVDLLPTTFWYAPTPYWSQGGRNGVTNQGDDCRAVMKLIPRGFSGAVSFEVFDELPQVSVLSGSMQYGGGREPRFAWSGQERMPIENLSRTDPRPTVVPNVRTREGVRLRWFDEHLSNRMGSGELSGTAHFEDALLANWNPRASFILRSPWDNLAGKVATGAGEGSGPWFFGAYTRDLFDQAVSWQDQEPVLRNGRYHGNPFGPPQEAVGPMVLFDVPRRETGIASLARFQHVKLSDFIWHPSYAIGNSLVDPRLGRGGDQGIAMTDAVSVTSSQASLAGWDAEAIGWSTDTQRSQTKDEWAHAGRSLLASLPEVDNLVYDLSYEVNRTLWDRYFLSTGTDDEKRRWWSDPRKAPLPNGRMEPVRKGGEGMGAELLDFHRAGSKMWVRGAFNVNSLRVEAWKAVLSSTRTEEDGVGRTVFPRILTRGEVTLGEGGDVMGEEGWQGVRVLTDEEVGRLAEAIVEQVRRRGPFLSMADFVNRRLEEDESGRVGALQAAIDAAGINQAYVEAYPLDRSRSLPDYRHPDGVQDATRLEQTLKPASKAWGAPAYVTQADVLQVVGPVLAARSDTFLIRAYGDVVGVDGEVEARAWCEAVVQRMPEPVVADGSGLNPRREIEGGDWGRRLELVSFRWLSPEEI